MVCYKAVINSGYHGLLEGARSPSTSDLGFCKNYPAVSSWAICSTMEQKRIVCRGSHPVAKAFNTALTRMMLPLSDTWSISVGVTVPLVTPPCPG